jgi:hypothetical protein
MIYRFRNNNARDLLKKNFDKIDESIFNHDSESFERHEHDRIFYKKSGLREITLITENKSPSQLANEILRSILS